MGEQTYTSTLWIHDCPEQGDEPRFLSRGEECSACGMTSEKATPTETVLRHDPDSGCTLCPLLDCGMCRALYDEDRDVVTLVGPDAGTSAPAFCPLRKGRVVVESSDG